MNSIRNGNFNSSEIVALTSMGERNMTEQELAARPKKGKGSATTKVDDPNTLGEAAINFIIECNMERRLGRSISEETDARPLSWGKLLETYVHELLGTNYEYFSDKTKQHPEISCWVGTADFLNHGSDYSNYEQRAIDDSKCPWTMKSFCQLVDPWYAGLRDMEYWNALRNGWKDSQGHFRKPHKDADKFFYQLVSNSCIYGTKYAELVVFMPYKSELDTIRAMANAKGIESGMFWIWSQPDEKLPHLVDGGHYQNLNVFRFEVPFLEKQFLKDRVLLAEKQLIKVPELIEA